MKGSTYNQSVAKKVLIKNNAFSLYHWCRKYHIWYTYHVTTIQQTIIESGRKVGKSAADFAVSYGFALSRL